jgi:hypothetical protein
MKRGKRVAEGDKETRRQEGDKETRRRQGDMNMFVC